MFYAVVRERSGRLYVMNGRTHLDDADRLARGEQERRGGLFLGMVEAETKCQAWRDARHRYDG